MLLDFLWRKRRAPLTMMETFAKIESIVKSTAPSRDWRPTQPVIAGVKMPADVARSMQFVIDLAKRSEDAAHVLLLAEVPAASRPSEAMNRVISLTDRLSWHFPQLPLLNPTANSQQDMNEFYCRLVARDLFKQFQRWSAASGFAKTAYSARASLHPGWVQKMSGVEVSFYPRTSETTIEIKRGSDWIGFDARNMFELNIRGFATTVSAAVSILGIVMDAWRAPTVKELAALRTRH